MFALKLAVPFQPRAAWHHLFSEYRANSENRKEMMSRGSLNHVQNVHLETRAARSADGAESSGTF